MEAQFLHRESGSRFLDELDVSNVISYLYDFSRQVWTPGGPRERPRVPD